MPKEWILNSATNRFQLNFKRNVGAVSEEIRKCKPKTVKDWENYYFKNVKPRKHITELGKKLYIKITEVVASEVEVLTEKDCVEYIYKLIINRTFDGYMTEKTTIYGQLQDILKVKIESTPDEWDRLFNVDFFIKLNGSYIGLQVKPVSDVSHIPQIYKERQLQEKTHENFKKKYGGKVFYVISVKNDRGKKEIRNTEVIEGIKNEIERLKQDVSE